MFWIASYISYILLGLSVLTIIFPRFYVSELVISFLPYLVAMHIFLACYWFSRYFLLGKRWKIVVLALVHGIGFAYFVLPLGFYQGNVVGDRPDQGMSVLYANISKLNRNYSGLIEMIQEKDPDVVMFVEFADHHDEHIKGFLSQNYPYINRTSRSKKFVGSMVFSKYPVDDLADDFVKGAWRYGYFRIDGPVGSYYVYLVHTSSPISPFNYHMRNEQLTNVADHISRHDSSRESAIPVLLLGDFNVSPWSVFYGDFVQKIPQFENISSRFSILFTWRLKRVPLFWSHIDHVFSTAPDTIGYIEQVDVPGSDHVGYYFIVE